MGLSLLDCLVGTIVDHRVERLPDGREKLRLKVRRGIVVKVEGEATSTGGVSALWVKFSKEGKAENVPPAELSRFLPATNKRAREAYRRVMDIPRTLGIVQESEPRIRPRVEDAMALTPVKNAGPVSPEDNDPLITLDGGEEGDVE